jgi:hypothetical protein
MRYTLATLTDQVHRLARSLEVSAAIDDFQLSGDNAAFSAWLDSHASPPGVVREPRPTDRPTSTSRLGAGCGLITWHVIDDAVIGLPAREASREERYCVPLTSLTVMPEITCVEPRT